MKKLLQRSFVFLLLLSLISTTVVRASSYENEDVALPVFSQVSATGYLLMDGLTGAVLSSSNADLKLPMASTTKIMTCIVALEQADLSDEVEIPREAVGVEGSSIYLVRGERLTLEELLYALMLESANDAAVAIALHVSPDVASFSELMNRKATELGLKGTHYVNPHGLPAEGHFSTARDLCKLMSYALKNEAFRVFSSTKKTTISAPDSGTRFLANHNKLLRIYDACISGKTGFTKEAGRCLVTAAEKEGRTLVCATLGDPNDWLDHIALYDDGFSQFSKNQIVEVNQITRSVPLVGGTEPFVDVRNDEGLSFFLRPDEMLEMRVELPRFAYADVEKGQNLGYLVYSLKGNDVKRIRLVSTKRVQKRNEKMTFWEKVIQRLKLWMI